jgi:predicted adenine nucleotide alpha hydrolase (AANH) superfamily ATPase
VEALAGGGAEGATVLFYNPNIFPEEEYLRRKAGVARVCETFGVPAVDLDYEPEAWARAVKGLERCPERGARCSACFYLRLARAAKYAAGNGFECFSSTLGFSRFKDAGQVLLAAKRAQRDFGVPYADIGWRSLSARTDEIVRESGIYRQKYCGCKFSLKTARS